ncbi:MAG: NAD(P)/FAD-dependent oxidoreductase [Deltaproteobacteria bacterium]|jgi:protoporphyrinogen oxidase|nr:NAD(P)/FAD-dependent oxidoreductase [Deltaproteobacteria bacterium]
MNPKQIKNIAIVGAGPMGLSIAFYLSQKGLKPIIFEALDHLGGMSSSVKINGFTIEKFYHFINKPDTHYFELLKELGLFDLLRWQPTKMGYFRKNRLGEFTLYDWGSLQALLRFNEASLITRLRYGTHALYCKFLKNLEPLDTIPARDWIERWEGKSGYTFFWKSLFDKKFFEFSEPLSAAWIASRIRRVAKCRDKRNQEWLGYIEGGTQVFLDKISDTILSKGCLIKLKTPVTKIIPEPGGTGGKLITQEGENYFSQIISTIPLPYLSDIISELPTDYRTKVSNIKNIGCICVLFILGKSLTNNFWLNIDIKDWDIPGIIEYNNLRPLEKAFVYLPFYCPHSHPNWKLTDQEIIELSRSYLREINLESAKTEEKAIVFRYEYAQPVFIPSFKNLLPDYNTGLPGIWAADTSHSYFEDRSINESVKIAKQLSNLIYSFVKDSRLL